MRKPTVFIVCALALLIVLSACNPNAEQEEKLNLLEISADTTAADINSRIADYDGVVGIGDTQPVIDVSEDAIKVGKDLYFENIIVSGAAKAYNKDSGPIGFNHDSATDVTLTLNNVTITGCSFGIYSNNDLGKMVSDTDLRDSSIAIIATDSIFTSCFKGMYITDLSTMELNGCQFISMGTDSATTEVTKRSGSGIDINQFIEGDTITITDCIFMSCGSEAGSTSGAIKVKARGGVGDSAADIADYANGSFNKLTVSGCTFIGNYQDVVLGTSGVASTKDNIKSIDIQSGINVADKSIKENPETNDDSAN